MKIIISVRPTVNTASFRVNLIIDITQYPIRGECIIRFRVKMIVVY